MPPRDCGWASRWRKGRSTTCASAPQQPLSEQEQAVLNKPVSDLNLSVRARKCMNRLGINTLGDLVSRTADELLESKNFGMTSLNEVREKLATVRPDPARGLRRINHEHRDTEKTQSKTRMQSIRSLALCSPSRAVSVSRGFI